MSGDSSTLRIKALGVPTLPEALELASGRLSIGRAEDNDVVLAGENFPSVSAHHVRFELQDDVLWVQDMGSRNGTLVNGSPIEHAPLQPGDVVRLGPVGPRFVLLAGTTLGETAFVDPERLGFDRGRGMSQKRVEELVNRKSRSNLRRVLGLVTVLAAASLAVMVTLSLQKGRDAKRRESETRDELAATRSLLDAFESRSTAREAELLVEGQARDAREASLRGELADALTARDELRNRIDELEDARSSTAGRAELETLRQELAGTRTRLDEARKAVDMLDPVNLEQERLHRVAAVRSAVVLLEVRLTLKNVDTGALLHESSTPAGLAPNFDGKGKLWKMESTGSGFCISEQGHVMTNAHVVSPELDRRLELALAGLPIEPSIEVEAVFSGEELRHPAKVLSTNERDDLALVQITPFETMPHLAGLDVGAVTPAPGSDVFLFGFPLGNFALQEGERVIASTFRGILSREVDGVLQVDAGVHPGNSGGPITDVTGRVIGVVFSVQATPDQTAVYTIGYGVPIAKAAGLWPPPAQAAPSPQDPTQPVSAEDGQ